MNVKQTVPALTAEPAAASDGERNRELPGRPTVLVVDDEERNRLFLRPVLHKHYRIVEADCGPKALGILKTQVIDLVLLDVMMPEMTGFEACKLIKDQYRNPYLPVLIVTGLTDREQRKIGLQSGADDFLTKPVDDEELLLRTRAFLRLRAQDSLIRQQLKELAKMHLAKDEMTSLMVHDLRSPLAGIMAHLRLLLDDLPEGRSHDDVSAALRAADSMFGTLEEALQIRLLEEGHLDISRQPVDLGEFVKRAVLTLEAVARRKKIALDVRVEPGEPALLDEKLVRRAIENLLGNALKYTPSGRDISVGVRRLPEKIAIEVADRGPGIPADMKGSMFRYRSGATR